MPINYQEIYTQIKQVGLGAKERRKRKEEAQNLAQQLLETFSSELDALRTKVEAAKAADANIRCAVPLDEALASHYPVPDSVSATLIAADGSQSIADRHSPVQFCVINVGGIVMKPNSGETPAVEVESELFFGDAIEENGLTTEGGVALRRDLAERSVIEKMSKGLKGSIVSFTDGTLEIFRAKDIDNANMYRTTIDKYISVLSRLQGRGIISAGYIDKPSSSLVVKLLELTQITIPEEMEKLRNAPPLKYVTDRWLFGYNNKLFQLLPPGHRSAVFKIQSNAEKTYKGVLELHFFYLNVGTEGHPWPVRVEIPRWVVDDKKQLDLLHAVLVEQCRVMGSKPYPYLLHRAHETAVVKNEEKYQIEQMLQQELRRNSEDVDEGSNKQSAKDLQGRTRR
ncbi:MAG: DNA double-strand break repair nuclease NurA [Anaerolineales bacterium]|nr:DNA double-strand break repair nuclease NurA [Anaerolineales bacterium]MCB9146225.1 DNA double-strand break repair nuclease NurA [Anaerolineales bacterium]